MSSLPRPHRVPQETLPAKALRLAVQLTPQQRSLVAQAGLPRWLEEHAPFRPEPGRELAAVQALASAEYGLLEVCPNSPSSFRLTLLGELVAAVWLTALLDDGAPVASTPFRPLRSL